MCWLFTGSMAIFLVAPKHIGGCGDLTDSGALGLRGLRGSHNNAKMSLVLKGPARYSICCGNQIVWQWTGAWHEVVNTVIKLAGLIAEVAERFGLSPPGPMVDWALAMDSTWGVSVSIISVGVASTCIGCGGAGGIHLTRFCCLNKILSLVLGILLIPM